MKYEGAIYAFRENGITMGIVLQGAVFDQTENLKGFETFMPSLTIKL